MMGDSTQLAHVGDQHEPENMKTQPRDESFITETSVQTVDVM